MACQGTRPAVAIVAKMLGNTYPDETCSGARALEIVGERWTLLVMRNALFAGHTRYNQFLDGLGLASNILAKRLETLVEAGLLEQRFGPQAKSRPEYHVTQMGRDLAPVIVALTQWGDRWLGEGPMEFVHFERQTPVTLEFRTKTGGRRVESENVAAVVRNGPTANSVE